MDPHLAVVGSALTALTEEVEVIAFCALIAKFT
jgi:hypothetical protein